MSDQSSARHSAGATPGRSHPKAVSDGHSSPSIFSTPGPATGMLSRSAVRSGAAKLFRKSLAGASGIVARASDSSASHTGPSSSESGAPSHEGSTAAGPRSIEAGIRDFQNSGDMLADSNELLNLCPFCAQIERWEPALPAEANQ